MANDRTFTLYIGACANEYDDVPLIVGVYYSKEDAVIACREHALHETLTFEKENTDDKGVIFWSEWSGFDHYRIYKMPVTVRGVS